MRPSLNSRRRATGTTVGFTLVEVLIALVIIAVTLAAVGFAIGHAIDLSADLRDRTVALWVAEERATAHQLKRDFPALDTTEGTMELGGHEWRWRERVSQVVQIADLRRIDIEVRPATSPDVLARLAMVVRRQ